MVKRRTAGADFGLSDVIEGLALQSSSTSHGNFEYNLKSLDITLLHTSTNQPRRIFCDEDLNELAESIKVNGILQPLVIRKKGDTFEIISGERRWRAAQLAGLTQVPCLELQADEQQSAIYSLVENIQREDLNTVDEALAYKNIFQEFKITQEELADALGKPRTTIANKVRILKLEPAVVEMLRKETIDLGHAKLLLNCPADIQLSLGEKIASQNLSVRDVEKILKSSKSITAKTIDSFKERDKSQDALLLEKKLKGLFGKDFNVKIKKNAARDELVFTNEVSLRVFLDSL